MASAVADDFLESLYQYKLLQQPQFVELAQLQQQFADSRNLARVLVHRNWLTPFQVNRLMQGKGENLRIGSYLLLEQLGEGGMGRVYKARREDDSRLVALKVLRADLLENEIAVRRFQREVHAISRLNNPHIVQALDAGVADGQPYFAMEYIDGTDLSKMVRETGPLNVRQALEYIRQAAVGLQHAWEKRMVHRDIKPANILVTHEHAGYIPPDEFSKLHVEKWGLVKVLDMGLARMVAKDDRSASTLITQMNVVMGTPDYISPEQAINSHDCDIRSDLYSLGCTLYFLLAGKTPFPEGNVTEKLLQHRLDKPVPVEEVRRTELIARGADPKGLKFLSSKVGRLIRSLMYKDPKKRLQTPAELVEALTGVLSVSGSGVDHKTIPRNVGRKKKLGAGLETGKSKSTRDDAKSTSGDDTLPYVAGTKAKPKLLRWVLPAICVLAGGVVSLAGVLLVLAFLFAEKNEPQGKQKQRPTKARAEWNKLQPRFARPIKDPVRLWDDLLAFRLQYPQSPEAALAVDLQLKIRSPLDHVKRGDILKKSRFAWHPPELVAVLRSRPFLAAGAARAVAFHPSLHYFASGWDQGGSALWKSDALPYPVRPLAGFRGSIAKLAFSADGGLLAVAASDGKLAVWEIAKQKYHVLNDEPGQAIVCARFTPDGKKLIAVDYFGEIRLWDRQTPKKAKVLAPVSDGEIPSAAISPDTRIIARGRDDSRLEIFPRDNPALMEHLLLLAMADQVSALAFSPDGDAIFAGGSKGHLFICERKGSRFQLAARRQAHDDAIRGIAVAPDNKRFVTAAANGQVKVWKRDQPRPLWTFDLRLPIHDVAFAPDGRHIAVARAGGTVYLLRLAEPAA